MSVIYLLQSDCLIKIRFKKLLDTYFFTFLLSTAEATAVLFILGVIVPVARDYIETHLNGTHILDETHLVMVRGLIRQAVSLNCVSEESSTERRSYIRQVNRSP